MAAHHQRVGEVLQRSSGFLSRLAKYYTKPVGFVADETPMAPSEPAPVISEQTALLCELLFTILYVAPFYLSSTLRSTPLQSRDAPTVIRARVRAVVLTCLACTIVTVYILAIQGHAWLNEILHLLGIWPVNPLDSLKVLGLVMLLFTCSLYESIIVDGEWRNWSFSSFKEATFDSWIGYRNLIVAPVSEEVVFRALTIPLFLLAKVSPTRIVFVTPLVFGLAHVHHLVDFLKARTPSGRRWPTAQSWIQGIVRSLFQFTYTSLFGFFAAFVFLRTGNVWAAILAHSVCNHMGVPRLWGKVGQFADYDHLPSELKAAADAGNAERDVQRNGTVTVGNRTMEGSDETEAKSKVALPPAGPESLDVGWTVAYYALIPIGAYGFSKLLFPLTESPMALAAF